MVEGVRVQSVALVYQPAVPEARGLAQRCAAVVEAMGYVPRFISAWELSPSSPSGGVHLAVTFGGDGTIIRAARWLAGTGVPILGTAMGKLGFMTELPPEVACEGLKEVLEGSYWVDERLMLMAKIGGRNGQTDTSVGGEHLLALNEVVVTRGSTVRVVHIDVKVDQAPLVRYVADGVIVATPTGSTAYSLAAGGPVLAPNVPAMLIVPVAAHLTPLRSIVVPPTSRVDLTPSADQPAVLVLDGQTQINLEHEQHVSVEVAREKTLFARTGKQSRFYETLVPSLKKR